MHHVNNAELHDNPSRRQDSILSLNKNDLANDIQHLLTLNSPDYLTSAQQRQSVDMLHDSVRVAKSVADLLQDYEADLTQRKWT